MNNLMHLGAFKGSYMNILLALSGLKSEAYFINASTSTQTALTCLAESRESVSGVDKSMPLGKQESNEGRNGSSFHCAPGDIIWL